MMAILEISHPTGLHEPKTIVKKTINGEINGKNKGEVNGNTQSNGSSRYPEKSSVEVSEDDFAVLSFRNLLFDICNQYGGHGGSAIGMAAIGVALFKYEMRYNPSNPEWFDRDRFVLSNGETVILSVIFVRTLTKDRTRCDVPIHVKPSRRIRRLDYG